MNENRLDLRTLCVSLLGIDYRIGWYNNNIIITLAVHRLYKGTHSPGLVKVDAAPLIRRVALLPHHHKPDAENIFHLQSPWQL